MSTKVPLDLQHIFSGAQDESPSSDCEFDPLTVITQIANGTGDLSGDNARDEKFRAAHEQKAAPAAAVKAQTTTPPQSRMLTGEEQSIWDTYLDTAGIPRKGAA